MSRTSAVRELRHPRAWLERLTGGGPVYPIVVLFGLNAVDELDRTAFGILLPEIRDEFGLDLQGVLTLVAVVGLASLALQVPIAALADRGSRVTIAWVGALAWGVFSLLTGLAASVLFLAFVRTGSGIGKAVVDPTHNSLIADYYAPEVRPRVYSLHRAANAVGAFVGPLSAGLLASAFGWRMPFFVFTVPTLVFVVLAWKLREPVRGAQERRAMGGDEASIATEEPVPSFAEGWRLVWKIETLRRIWWSLPFLAASLIGFVSLASLLYEQVFGLDEKARGFVAAAVEPVQLAGLVIGASVGTRLLAKGPEHVLAFLAKTAWLVSACLLVFALAPNIVVAMIANAIITGALAVLGPGILATLSLAIPPRARAMGFSVASLWVIPGLVFLPIVGAVGDRYGIRQGMVLMVPMFLIGGLMISTTRHTIRGDIEQVWRASLARAEAVEARAAGDSQLLVVREVEVGYDGVQVLFGVDLEIGDGEIVALLGTNGAGKSTLLAAITGVVEADRGAVIFDGRDITHAPAHEIARLGVSQVPGGKGVFPSLTVADNIGLASWSAGAGSGGAARIVELFPELEPRMASLAGDLSGGQQQMLALGMTLLARPRLLLIDELSLGLAPVIVARLLPVIDEFRRAGTAVVLVEQSVNVALEVADRAIFLERGQVRFTGPTVELLDRPDVLRAVFLAGAGDEQSPGPPAPTGNGLPSPTADQGEVVLATVGLTKRFGGVGAVTGVSLEIRDHEIVGVLGPNGAGKTTLFDLLSGFVEADAGSIALHGVDITAERPNHRARRGLGRSFQDARLFPSLTVHDAIAVAAERWTKTRDPISAALHLPNTYDSEREVAARVDELVELLGLGAWANAFVRELSTGTRRVVDLGCLLAHRPSVVLLDEPSSGIAQREVEALGPMLRRIREQTGAALVVIDHDIPLLREVSDRLVAMDLGAVIAVGTPAEVLDDPRVVESYLGSNEAAIHRSTHT